MLREYVNPTEYETTLNYKNYIFNLRISYEIREILLNSQIKKTYW